MSDWIDEESAAALRRREPYDFFWTAEGDPTEHSLRFWLIWSHLVLMSELTGSRFLRIGFLLGSTFSASEVPGSGARLQLRSHRGMRICQPKSFATFLASFRSLSA